MKIRRYHLPDLMVGANPFLPMPDDGLDGGGGAPPTESDPSTEPATGEEKDWKAEAEKWKTHARRHEERARANAAAAARVAELEAANLSESEKAIAEARQQAKAEALAEALTGRIVDRFELEALRAGRDATKVAELLEDLDLSRFRSDDGSIDVERIAKRVEVLPLATPGGLHVPLQRQGSTGQGAGAPPPAAPGSAGMAEAQRRYGQQGGRA